MSTQKDSKITTLPLKCQHFLASFLLLYRLVDLGEMLENGSHLQDLEETILDQAMVNHDVPAIPRNELFHQFKFEKNSVSGIFVFEWQLTWFLGFYTSV